MLWKKSIISILTEIKHDTYELTEFIKGTSNSINIKLVWHMLNKHTIGKKKLIENRWQNATKLYNVRNINEFIYLYLLSRKGMQKVNSTYLLFFWTVFSYFILLLKYYIANIELCQIKKKTKFLINSLIIKQQFS